MKPTTIGSGGSVFKVKANELALFSINLQTTHHFFQLNTYRPTTEWLKLNPQTEFGIPPGTAEKPTTISSSGYIVKVSKY